MGAIHRCQINRCRLSQPVRDAVFEGRPACGVWKGDFLSWHINCLELRAVFLALINFLPSLRGSCDCQDGQHSDSKSPGGFTIAHPKQACPPSPSLDSGQVVGLLLVAPIRPSRMVLELVPLLYRLPWEIPIRQDLLSQLQTSIWDLEAVGMAHPRPQVLIASLPAEVQEIIANARAPCH